MAESFFSTLEAELLARRRFASQGEAKMACFNSIEGWYNPARLHSALGYRSPITYEPRRSPPRSTQIPKPANRPTKAGQAQPEQEAQWKHMPAAADQPEQRSQNTDHDAAVAEQDVEVLVDMAFASPHHTITAPERPKDGGIHRRDGEQEHCRYPRADRATDGSEILKIAHQGRRRDNRHRDDGNDCRMTKCKEEADRDGPLIILKQLARNIVDRRDVVGIDGVVQPEAVD